MCGLETILGLHPLECIFRQMTENTKTNTKDRDKIRPEAQRLHSQLLIPVLTAMYPISGCHHPHTDHLPIWV